MKAKPKQEDTLKKALGEIAEQIASAKSYRESPKPNVDEFLSANKNSEDEKLAQIIFTSETEDEIKREFEGEN